MVFTHGLKSVNTLCLRVCFLMHSEEWRLKPWITEMEWTCQRRKWSGERKQGVGGVAGDGQRRSAFRCFVSAACATLTLCCASKEANLWNDILSQNFESISIFKSLGCFHPKIFHLCSSNFIKRQLSSLISILWWIWVIIMVALMHNFGYSLLLLTHLQSLKSTWKMQEPTVQPTI